MDSITDIQWKVVIKNRMAKHPFCSFSDLSEEAKKELNQQYFDRNGIYLSKEELEEAYKDCGFMKGLLERMAKERINPKGYKTVYQLSKDELTELKARHYTETHDSVSYGELSQIDDLVSDQEIQEAYSGIEFTEDDFFCDSERIDEK